MGTSRNDQCWCGSGKKYKKCHLEQDERLAAFQKKGYPIPPHRLIKSEAEIDGIRKSCQLTHWILKELTSRIRPGITTDEINTWVHETTLAHGAIPAPLNYKGFPKSTCISVNEVICHGIPGPYVLKEGDILNVDVTCILNGFYGDSCRMYPIGKIAPNAQKLIDVTKECLNAGIRAVKPFHTVGDIGRAIEEVAQKNGFSVVEIFGGHGIGTEFHDDPFIFHYSHPEKQMVMVPNMVFTIEPMINEGKPDAKILKDGWTAVTADGKLSAQWEHTVRVTETGVEILTA